MGLFMIHQVFWWAQEPVALQDIRTVPTVEREREGEGEEAKKNSTAPS